jgi:hypothetical protein
MEFVQNYFVSNCVFFSLKLQVFFTFFVLVDSQENKLAIDINGRKENPIDSNTILNESLPLSQRYFLF